ncbi:MAG: TlyA family RNA methyltransferase [Clostridia bacterium]|jgi:23S rRNA (cytidine1920-2'-O)/16S rRNA (cytidine1409-2'-O)-methyltransferase|nr:TlyA family RNA methyltransferase [Clostridia bacterium]
MKKVRLDLELVERGLATSREKAKALIMAGQVLVDEQKIDKAGTVIKKDAVIRLIGNLSPFVSRGGLKLNKAIEVFNLDLTNKVVADIGASTGGFTDCALQNNALKVFAIDVGYGQLDWKLRNDPRVINMERTNARYLTLADLGEKVDFISIDVAFISLEKILPAVVKLLKDSGEIVALIKPQFEAGKDKIGKKGVVKEPKVHKEVIENVLKVCADLQLGISGLTYSPIKGPEGNIEYLLWLNNANISIDSVDINQVVQEAFDNLSS